MNLTKRSDVGFLEANRLAAKGAMDDLKRTQMGNLALIILLDQFSRNIFRGAAEAFATDSKARQLAEHALEKRFDKNVLTVHGLFFYLPFEHAEDLESQAKSVNLFINLGDAVSLDHAICHRDQIVSRTGIRRWGDQVRKSKRSF